MTVMSDRTCLTCDRRVRVGSKTGYCRRCWQKRSAREHWAVGAEFRPLSGRER